MARTGAGAPRRARVEREGSENANTRSVQAVLAFLDPSRSTTPAVRPARPRSVSRRTKDTSCRRVFVPSCWRRRRSFVTAKAARRQLVVADHEQASYNRHLANVLR